MVWFHIKVYVCSSVLGNSCMHKDVSQLTYASCDGNIYMKGMKTIYKKCVEYKIGAELFALLLDICIIKIVAYIIISR